MFGMVLERLERIKGEMGRDWTRKESRTGSRNENEGVFFGSSSGYRR